MNAAMLLGPSERLEHQIEQIRQAVAVANLPYRMTEGNSCFGGGKPEVSDAFASALWGSDYCCCIVLARDTAASICMAAATATIPRLR